MKLSVDWQPERTVVTLPDEQGQILFSDRASKRPAGSVQLFVQDGQVRAIDEEVAATEVVTIQLPETVDLAAAREILRGMMTELTTAETPFLTLITGLLLRFGIRFTPPASPKQARPTKARHRFDKTLVDHVFYVTRNGSKASVRWTARTEMTIEAGAILSQERGINRDGSVRYDTKYGEKLRADYAAAIQASVTTQPVRLRSVNEVGMFLYFGNANGWLELVDAEGQTLDELTRVD